MQPRTQLSSTYITESGPWLQVKGSLFTNNVGCVPVSEWMC